MDNENKKHPLLRILLLDIGVVGTSIFGALGIIAIVFIALNYFNILSLSELYPKYLSSLPRQQSTQTTTKPINIQQNKSSSAGDLSTTDIKTLNNITQAFIDNLLFPLYQTRIDLKRSVLKSGQTSLPLYAASYSWQAGNVSSQLSISYDTDKEPLNIDLSMTVPHTKDLVSSSSAIQVLSPYILVSTNFQWSCKTFPATGGRQCNSMEIKEDKSKMGVTFRANSNESPSNTTDLINICQIFPNSSRYSWSTCLHE